jgi:hypothetical protein
VDVKNEDVCLRENMEERSLSSAAEQQKFKKKCTIAFLYENHLSLNKCYVYKVLNKSLRGREFLSTLKGISFEGHFLSLRGTSFL